MSNSDLDSIFSRLEKLSLSSNLPTALPDFSHYEYLASNSSSQFIFFVRLVFEPTTATPSSSSAQPLDQSQPQFYIPFFTDSYHTLLHEIANYNELPHGVDSVLSLDLKAEGTEVDGGVAELDLGLDGIRGQEQWEKALGKLREMGFGACPEEGAPEMGEGVVCVVKVAA